MDGWPRRYHQLPRPAVFVVSFKMEDGLSVAPGVDDCQLSELANRFVHSPKKYHNTQNFVFSRIRKVVYRVVN